MTVLCSQLDEFLGTIETLCVAPFPLAAVGKRMPHETRTHKAYFLSLVGPLQA